ncbi:MAG: hypothetical protein ACK5FT_02530 [Sphingomonadales bacterium]|jgi:topoisomerase IA-like protein
MKKLFLLSFFLIAAYAMHAQIGEVKVDGAYAKIYDENGRYTNRVVHLGSTKTLAGYNSQYIVVVDRAYAKIYDATGKDLNKSILLGDNKYIKHISGSAILVKDGNYVKYYDFDGRYTNKATLDR